MKTFMKFRMVRRTLAFMLLIATLTLSLTMSPALADSDKRVVKVMTQNIDAGTDLLFFCLPRSDSCGQLTYNELLATDFAAALSAGGSNCHQQPI
jgi:hypothetical protein